MLILWALPLLGQHLQGRMPKVSVACEVSLQ